MTKEERQKMLNELWEEQKRILGETKDNLGVFVTEAQLAQRRKLLFDLHLKNEYLGIEKAVNKIAPLVSVCIPTYQHKSFIEDCIKGALMQKTTFPFEIVICDDGSTDGTTEICKTYAARHQDKIRLYNHNRSMTRLFDSNGKIKSGHNWQWTLESARGKYIALCEGDDYWIDPLKLQKQVDFLEANTSYGLVYTDFDKLYQKTGKICFSVYRNRKEHRSLGYQEHLVNAGFLAPPTWMFRKELSPFWGLDRHTVDGSFVMILELFNISKIYYMDFVSAVYRSNQGSASRPVSQTLWYKRDKGVFEIQEYYLRKYPIEKNQENLVLIKGYLGLKKEADARKDYDFIKKLEKTLHENGLIDIGRNFFLLQEKYNDIKKSKPYQLGYFLLKPIYNFLRCCKLINKKETK